MHARAGQSRDGVFLEDLCPKFRLRHWRQSLHELTGQCCIYCGHRSESIDHVHPKSQGGPSITENCVPACLTCNRLKGDTEAFAWYRRQSFYDPRRAMAIRAWTDGDLRLALKLLQWVAPAGESMTGAGAAPASSATATAADLPHQTRQATAPLWRWQMAA